MKKQQAQLSEVMVTLIIFVVLLQRCNPFFPAALVCVVMVNISNSDRELNM